MEAKTRTPVQFGQTIGADFELNSVTLEMESGYIVAVGPVAVLPRSTYEEMLEALKTLVGAYDPEDNFAELDVARAAIAKALGA